MAEGAAASMEGLNIQEQAPAEGQPKPTVILVIGMAGSGKTTFLQRLNAHLHASQHPGYIVNLDPAVMHVPYGAHVDIRDTVNYKNVMKQYSLGPNGAILTSLNLFATRFDQVISLCEKPRDPPLQFIVADTPGQIEIFTWSASGAIITEAFAASFPTMVAYIIDTPRCVGPQTFMTNMLQACSLLYKTRLPVLLVFNKVDVARHEFALDWMADFEAFHQALDSEQSYAATLSRSMSLVLEQFYQNMRAVGVSAVTGEGMQDFMNAVAACRKEYEEQYLPDLERRKAERQELERRRQAAELERLAADRAAPAGAAGGSGTGGSGSTAGEGSAAGRRVLDGRKGATLRTLQEEEDEEALRRLD
ncbi:GPN-loop GTPase 1-like isoform X1 [Micractinium conductrix]|uniref:GPN-loop GTPase n=1 Tax=Micractinium conductrix TaxID=554055 RepID=A0A2P6V4K0_9CHLO|nr:GPN-loop GTPase 1-like isoform X1 [Micractinium conductrix]|eukprot:PSC68999.1 GPN-loop GTPase 1-like isoform X1 [Micractinium conductrix]